MKLSVKNSAAPDCDDGAPLRQRSTSELDEEEPKISREPSEEVREDEPAVPRQPRRLKNDEPRRSSPSHSLDESDFDDEDYASAEGNIRPCDPDPELKWERYPMTEEFQDMMLASYIRHSDEFGTFHKVFSPKFFSGPEPTMTAWMIQDYAEKYNRVPDFSALANFCYHQTRRSMPDQAEKIRDYVIKLEKIDTANWKYARDRAMSFARANALQRVMVEFVEAREKGEDDKIDWEDKFRQAKRFDNFGLPGVKDLATTAKVPPPDVLVDGLLHFSSKLALGGSAKASKSFLLMALAVAVATGSKWLGRKCTRAKVLLVDFELHEGFLQARARKIAESMKVEIEPGWLSYLCLRGIATPASEILPKIIALAGNDRGLVVLDPAYRLYDVKTTNENDMAKIAGMMLEMEKICERTGAAVALGTHFAKGDQSKKASIDRIGGSRAFVADPDSILTFTALKEEDAYAVEATLRNFARPPKFGVRWKYPVFEPDPSLDPEDLHDPTSNTKYSDRDFMNPLTDGPLEKKKLKQEVLEATGMESKTFTRRIEKLVQTGRVLEKDGFYSLARTGQDQMSNKPNADDSSD